MLQRNRVRGIKNITLHFRPATKHKQRALWDMSVCNRDGDLISDASFSLRAVSNQFVQSSSTSADLCSSSQRTAIRRLPTLQGLGLTPESCTIYPIIKGHQGLSPNHDIYTFVAKPEYKQKEEVSNALELQPCCFYTFIWGVAKCLDTGAKTQTKLSMIADN